MDNNKALSLHGPIRSFKLDISQDNRGGYQFAIKWPDRYEVTGYDTELQNVLASFAYHVTKHFARQTSEETR